MLTLSIIFYSEFLEEEKKISTALNWYCAFLAMAYAHRRFLALFHLSSGTCAAAGAKPKGPEFFQICDFMRPAWRNLNFA